jgi:hypothetical protein
VLRSIKFSDENYLLTGAALLGRMITLSLPLADSAAVLRISTGASIAHAPTKPAF